MPLLNAEQVQRLQAIQLARDTHQLGEVLAGLFPDVPARLGERFPALIAHAVQRGAAHGLVHAVCVARLLACWFVLGAEFENKPGFDWARQLLADTRRTQGAKVFQLCRRTREMLARWGTPNGPGAAGMPAAQPMTPQAFDQAIAALDAALMDVGDVGALQRGGRVVLGQACDIDALDLRPASADTSLFYAVQQGQWARVPATAQPAPVTLRAGRPAAGGDVPGAAAAPTAPTPGAPAGAAGPTGTTGAAGTPGAPALPPRLTLLGRPAGSAPARLRLRTLAAQCCDALVHPLVVLNGAQGVSEWRGGQAADIVLELYSPAPAAAPDGALQPAIAVESAAQVSLLQLSSCGLREDGEALGDLQTQIAVYPAEQHLVAWRREALGELRWPEPPGGHPPPPAPRCRIERDGTLLDATRWQAGLADLDRQLLAALPRLLTAWERTSGVSQGHLTAEPRVLCGDAGISWGWAAGAPGMQSPPCLRIAGRMELIACQLSLHFAGQLAIDGTISRVSLQSHAREALQASWERAPGDADLLPAAAPATPVQTTFRQPFVLHVDSLAQAEVALLDGGPVTGAVVGSCGLRVRADGQGLQWFAQIAIEPVAATLHLHDPLLGQQALLRPLLPAMKLLDWSLP